MNGWWDAARRWIWKYLLRPPLVVLPKIVWHFSVGHLFFFLPIRLPALESGTDAANELKAEFEECKKNIATLDDASLDLLNASLDDELKTVGVSISETRSRAAQLLAVTAFIAVLATLGASPPAKGVTQLLTLIFAGLAAYALLGTLWLTVQALAVRSWDEMTVKPIGRITARRMREEHAYNAYRVRRRLSIRRRRPVGYLRDAYWFFVGTVVLIVALVVVRVVGVELTSQMTTPTPTPSPSSAPQHHP